MTTPTQTTSPIQGVTISGKTVTVENAAALESEQMDALVRDAVFGDVEYL